MFVNPAVGANFSGGAGSGGAIRIVANEIENLGIIEARGGDASGADYRETGSKYLRDAGGAGGGGRVALLADNLVRKGIINLNGGVGTPMELPAPRVHYSLPKSASTPLSLALTTGTLTLDTGGHGIILPVLKEKDR